MTIGEKIRKIRELKNLKQLSVARKLGLSLTAYGNIERNEASITFEKLEQIAQALEVSVHDIINLPDKLDVRQFSVSSRQNDRVDQPVTRSEIEAYKLCIEQYKKESDFLREIIKELTSALRK